MSGPRTVLRRDGRTRAVDVPDLVEALRLALEDGNDPEAWDQSRLHASDLGYSSVIENPSDRGCQRQLWYRVKGFDERPPTSGELLMYDQGHRMHERLSELIQRGLELLGSGWSILHTELRVEADLDGELTGTLDVELGGPNGELVVVDYKTRRGNAFRWLYRAKPGNVIQLQSYMMAVDADFGIIVYVDREGSNFARQFPVARDDERVRQAAEEIQAIAADNLTPPVIAPKLERRENKGPDSIVLKLPWQCEWCRFHGDTCKGAVPEDVAGRVVAYLDENEKLTSREGYEAYYHMVHEELARGVLSGDVDLTGEHGFGSNEEGS